MRKTLMSLGLVALGLSCSLLAEKDAAACGGCFQPPGENPTAITDHRMILSVSPQQTTLYDQIRYQGSPSSFAWVLPIAGEAKVGLSADVLFTTLDRVSQTTIVAPPPNCPGPPSNCASNFGAAGGGADAGTASDGGVVVSHNQVVGPYETVQLHSTDPNALNDWLSTHGYAIPDDVKPIISAYVAEHFDFLAMKLVPGANVQSMRPVRVTTAGASPTLPLRMVAAGTGATVGITLWIVADGRYEPQNFDFFHIEDSELVWDWNANQSNYRGLRAQKTAAGAGHVWELESSLSQSQSVIENQVRFGSQGNPYFDAGSPEYPPVTGGDGGVTETSDESRAEDMKALFTGIANDTFRLTRVRADLAHAALATDLVLRASSDQSVLSNIRRTTGESGSPQCPIYQGCEVVGYGPRPPSDQINPNGDDMHTRDSFNCATSSKLTGLGEPVTYAGLAAFVGFAWLRSRRRRPSK